MPALAVALLGLIAAALILAPVVRGPADSASMRATTASRVQRAFTPSSWWNTPLPNLTPLHPSGAAILRHLGAGPDSGDGCLVLGGAGNNRWGIPVYWAVPSDPEFDVVSTEHPLPPELATLRIPRGARPADNSDSEMIVYDLHKGYAAVMTHASYSPATGWRASGATVTYLGSNGLHVKTGRSDDPRNTGTHRGNNAPTMLVSWDQVAAGAIRHVLKIAAGPETADRAVFPMIGSDGNYHGWDPAVPPQGLRVRVKASIDLDALDLAPQALVVARALQRYGAYIGDSGGRTGLKLEDTVTEGRGQLWNLDPTALCALPFDERFWDVVAVSYDPTRSQGAGG